MLGDGFTVMDAIFLSPVCRKIILLWDTYRYIIKTYDKAEILVHIRFDVDDLVHIKWKSFIKINDLTNVGTPVIEIDSKKYNVNKKTIKTAIVILNLQDFKTINCK